MSDSTTSPLHKLFVEQLKDIYWAEKQLAKVLPKKAKAAKHPALKKAVESHAAETLVHVSRIEEAFASLSLTPRAKKCDAMAGLLEEGDEIAEEFGETSASDAAAVCAAQKIEHYEIATYGTLVALAESLGYREAMKLLSATLKDEHAANNTLSKIGVQYVNPAGMS